jgi:hypothetical protein
MMFYQILTESKKLSSNTQRQWGKMNVEQILSHLNAFLETALDLNSPKRLFYRKNFLSVF